MTTFSTGGGAPPPPRTYADASPRILGPRLGVAAGAAVLVRTLLTNERFHPRQVAPHRAHLVGCLELTHRLLNPHPEQLVDQIPLLGRELIDPQWSQFRRLHSIFS